MISQLSFYSLYSFKSKIENRKSKIGNRIFNLSISAAGFLLPFAITNLWYYFNGHFDVFFNIVYCAPSKYPAAFDPWKLLKFLLDFHLRFLPLFVFYYYALFHKGFKVDSFKTAKQLGLLWTVMALVAVLLAGKTFGHYMIQLMLPIGLLSGMFFAHFEMPSQFQRFFVSKTALVAALVIIAGIASMKLEYVFKKDIPKEIATYLKPKLKPGEMIYTGNYHHIIYYLLKKDSPTKYVHRTLLTGEHHIKALDIDAEAEFRSIMAQRPVYIIVQKEYPVKKMNDFIKENYTLEKTFEENVFLYKINTTQIYQ